jgi:hypothetical protein
MRFSCYVALLNFAAASAAAAAAAAQQRTGCPLTSAPVAMTSCWYVTTSPEASVRVLAATSAAVARELVR